MDVKDFRIVTVHLHNKGVPTKPLGSFYMHEDQVARFTAAVIDLHHVRGNIHVQQYEEARAAKEPGYKPRNHRCDNLWEITVSDFRGPETFCWTSEKQQANDPEAAQIYQSGYSFKSVWVHPLLQKKRDDEAAEDCPCC